MIADSMSNLIVRVMAHVASTVVYISPEDEVSFMSTKDYVEVSLALLTANHNKSVISFSVELNSLPMRDPQAKGDVHINNIR